jgi:hypothetical protein
MYKLNYLSTWLHINVEIINFITEPVPPKEIFCGSVILPKRIGEIDLYLAEIVPEFFGKILQKLKGPKVQINIILVNLKRLTVLDGVPMYQVS